MFTIEDQAPPFDPLSASLIEDEPAPSSIDHLRPGGRGIRLLRKFAGTLAYQRLAGGNRLTIGFVLPVIGSLSLTLSFPCSSELRDR